MKKYLSERKDDNPYLFPKMIYGNEAAKKGKMAKLREGWKHPELIMEGHMDKRFRSSRWFERLERVQAFKMCIRTGSEGHARHMPSDTGCRLNRFRKMLGHEQLNTTKIYLDQDENSLEKPTQEVRCMTKEEIIKTVGQSSGAYTPHQIFRDWIECLALSVANASMVHHDEVWERHEEIFTAVMKKYDSKMLETFAQMTGGLIDLYESGFDDFLGDIYMKAGCGSGVLGAVFHTVPSFGTDGRNGGSGGCFRR